MKKVLLPLLALMLAIVAKADVEDVLNQSLTGVSGNAYTEFSGKQDKSNAVYAGQCAGNYNSIQLRSTNNNSGVVTTTSGGKAKKVTIKWNTSTTANRVVQVYGSNTAYTKATNLYDLATSGGDPIHEFTYDGSKTEDSFDITGDYAYIGFKSKSGALYIDSFSILWDGEAREGEGGEEGGEDEPVTIADPTISPKGGYYANSVEVTLAQEAGVTIHYTLDGSTPTAESPVYTAPFTLTSDEGTTKTVVTAIAIDDKGNSSKEVSATYYVVVVKPMTIGEGQVGFDFVMNPWNMTLATSNSGTDGIITSLTASDDATTLTVDKGEASYNTYLYSYNAGGQLRGYKKSSFTIKAAEGKYISKVEFNFTNTGSKLQAGETEYSSTNAVWSVEEAVASVTFDITANAQINTILVTLTDDGKDDGGDDEPEPEPEHASIANTLETAYTVKQARDTIAKYFEGDKEVLKDQIYVKGVVCYSEINTGYGNATFWLKDSMEATDSLEAYRCFDFEGQKFTAADKVEKGDTIVVTGTTTIYTDKNSNQIYEFNANCYLAELKKYQAPAKDIADPTFSLESGTYYEAQSLVITGPEGYGIIYTTDGTDPEDGNGTYVTTNTATVSIEATTTVKAIAVDNDDPDFTSNVKSVTITIVPTYNSIAALKAGTAEKQADAVDSYFKFENLTVTGVSGSNVFITDGTEGFLLYGANSGLQMGDIISGQVAGKPYKYNGLREMSVSDWTGITKADEKAEVTPKELTVADIISAEGMDKYESMYVRFTGVKFVNEQFANQSNTLAQGESEVVIYNTAKLADINNATFSASIDYNVNVYVVQRNGAAQVYPLTADFYDYVTELADAESSWNVEGDILYVKDEAPTLLPTFSTKSDATPAYESSNETVATVSAEGQVTLVGGAGIATITATTAETEQYLPSSKVLTIYVLSGADGTAEKPYTPADVQILFAMNDVPEGKVWAKGTIAGNVNTSKGNTEVPESVTDASATNLSLETDGYNISIQLTANTDPRTYLNLKDNFDKIGTEVALYGNIEKYCGVAGLKNVTEATIDGVAVGISEIAADAAADASKAIYTIAGQKVDSISKPGLYIVDGKKVLVK